MNIDTIATQQTPEEKELARKYRYDNAKLMAMDLIERGLIDAMFTIGKNKCWSVIIYEGKHGYNCDLLNGEDGFIKLTSLYEHLICA